MGAGVEHEAQLRAIGGCIDDEMSVAAAGHFSDAGCGCLVAARQELGENAILDGLQQVPIGIARDHRAEDDDPEQRIPQACREAAAIAMHERCKQGHGNEAIGGMGDHIAGLDPGDELVAGHEEGDHRRCNDGEQQQEAHVRPLGPDARWPALAAGY